jgi:hypothetical protein
MVSLGDLHTRTLLPTRHMKQNGGFSQARFLSIQYLRDESAESAKA